MALLKITNLKKSYNITKTQKQDVLKGVDIEFKSGDLIALLGESGCGKSTLINILGGLDTDYTGSVIVKNEFISVFTFILKLKKFNKVMNMVVMETKVEILSDEEINRILNFGEETDYYENTDKKTKKSTKIEVQGENKDDNFGF